jgi:hypothetical protein
MLVGQLYELPSGYLQLCAKRCCAATHSKLRVRRMSSMGFSCCPTMSDGTLRLSATASKTQNRKILSRISGIKRKPLQPPCLLAGLLPASAKGFAWERNRTRYSPASTDRKGIFTGRKPRAAAQRSLRQWSRTEPTSNSGL